ncbi:molecular chaperone [Salinimicrobium flavum]|uniref:Molecular chaperone n=1 Tax=Salinimicrobium flavum TaxID=1737065 RepID=A0ABW5IY53_9FLAO
MKNILLLLLLFILDIPHSSAQGDLMIMPKRVVFDGSQRSQEINLANTGQDTAIYAISFINYKMTQNGNFEQVEAPEEGQRFATDLLRYFPRRVTLAPNEAQTIRVQLTRTGNLEQGEYRSHMYFRAVEEQKALGEEDLNSSEGIAIQIKTVFGISIPIIIRHGESTTNVSLSEIDLNLDGENPQLSMVINRTGNMSVYGNLKVEHISKSRNTTQLGLVRGISVYTPNRKRKFTMELNKIEGVDLKNGKLRITYTSDKGDELAVYE